MKKSLFVLFGIMFLFNGVANAEQRCGECVCGNYSKDSLMGGFVDISIVIHKDCQSHRDIFGVLKVRYIFSGGVKYIMSEV